MYAFGSVYVECWCPWRPEALDAPEGGVSGGCTSTGVGGGAGAKSFGGAA